MFVWAAQELVAPTAIEESQFPFSREMGPSLGGRKKKDALLHALTVKCQHIYVNHMQLNPGLTFFLSILSSVGAMGGVSSIA